MNLWLGILNVLFVSCQDELPTEEPFPSREEEGEGEDVSIKTKSNHNKHTCIHNWMPYCRHSPGLNQDSSNLSLEVQSAAEFSSNPDQTHLHLHLHLHLVI